MNKPTANIYTTDDIHAMRVNVAEQYRKMTPAEVDSDFKKHVENAKRTMETLRRNRKLTG